MTRPHADLGKVVHHYLARLDPDGAEPDPAEGRKLAIQTWSDGTVTGSFQLDPLGGEKVQAALESLVQADRPKGDDRSRGQQLADALVQLAEIALGFEKLPMHRGSKPHVVLTMGPAICSTRRSRPAPAGSGSGLGSRRSRPATSAATPSSPRSPSTSTACRSTRAAPNESFPHTSAARSSFEMSVASSPAARPRTTGATFIMSSTGSTAARPRSRTQASCASGTIRRCTTGSPSNEIAGADGTPTGPTAPRS